MLGRLAIIVGHAEDAQGATATAPLSCTEWVYNRKVAKLIFDACVAYQIDAGIFTRVAGETAQKFYSRVNYYARTPRSCSIELHFNAFSDPRAKGTETLYDEGGFRLATLVQGTMLICFQRKGRENRGTKLLGNGDQRGYRNLKSVKCTSVIVEPFFGTCPEDATMGLNKMGQYAECLALAVKMYLTES